MHKYFILILLFSAYISKGQEIQTVYVEKSILKADQFIGVDELENIYYINNNSLYRQNEEETLAYSNVKLGKITSVHIQNPFKIILFYKDFNSIIILDNKLNALTDKIDFTRQSLFNNVQFVSPSSENNLWLLADNSKLYLYDFVNHQVILETQRINFYQQAFIPRSIHSTYKYIWVFAKNGLIQFNEYGSFIQYLDVENFDIIYPYQEGFIYLSDNSLYYLFNNKANPIVLEPNITVEDIYINGSSIYTFDGKYLYHYNIL